MLVEVLLEIEVGELLTLGDLEDLLERSIRGDVVLVLEALLLDIVVHLLGDIGAGDEGARGVTEELAELIGNLEGDLEDGEALGRITLGLSANTALALASILDLTVDTLVKALDLSDHGGDRLTERGEGGEDGLEVLIESGRRGSRGLGSRSGGRRGSDRDRRRSNRGGRGRGSGLLGDGLLGLSGRSSGNRGRRSDDRSRHRRRGDLIGLLGNTLGLGGRGGSRGGVHHIGTGGSIHLK